MQRQSTFIVVSRSLLMLFLGATSPPFASVLAVEQATYPVTGRYGLAAHKRGPSLEDAKSVVDNISKECADAGRWFDFKGDIRLDHFTGSQLTFKLQQAKFTPPDTYYLVEGAGIGDSFILHRLDDKQIDIVMTDGSNLFIQLWMVKCSSLGDAAH